MAEITLKRRGELVRGVFRLLLKEPEGLAAKDVLSRLEQLVPPTEFERSTYPNHPGVQRFEKIVRFSTIKAVKAGWLVKDKGLWSLTDEGADAYEKFESPEEFEKEAARLYRTWEAGRPDEPDEDEDVGPGPTATLEEAEEAAWAEIDGFLNRISPYDFQALFAGLLRGMGYHVSWVSPPGPDRGIDIIGYLDPLGLKGPRIKAQVKRRGDRVNVDGLRSFMSLLSDSDVGIFICTGGFTRDAEDEARRQTTRRITLMDSKRLFELWVEHYPRIPEESRRLLPLRAVHYLALDE